MADVAGETLRGQSGSLRDVDVSGVPLPRLHAQSGVAILGNRLYGDTTDFQQRRAAEHGAGTTEECRIPEVIAILNNAVEQLPFVWHLAKLAEVFSKGSGE
jgi:hypothetical protein